MIVQGTTSVLSDNTKIYAAFERKRGKREPSGQADTPAAATYFEIHADSAEIGRNATLEQVSDMASGREPSDPEAGQIDAPQRLTVGIDKRVIGFHLGALLGPCVTTDANAWGFIQFEDQPSNNEKITIGGSDWTFTTGAAGSGKTKIAADLATTVATLATNLNASTDSEISTATYLAEGHRLIVTADASGVAGNAITLAVSDSRFGFASGANLAGGGLKKHVFSSGALAIPSVSLVTDQTDLDAAAGPRWKSVVGGRYSSMEIAVSDSGAATAVFNIMAINERAEASDPIDGFTKAVAWERFSHLQGGILVDDACACGVLENGTISYNNGLTADRTLCCPGSPDAGAIKDAQLGRAQLGFSARARYYSPEVTGPVEAGSPVKMYWALHDPNDGSRLEITMGRVYFPESARTYQAGSTVLQNIEGQPSKPAGAATMVVTLVNDVAGY